MPCILKNDRFCFLYVERHRIWCKREAVRHSGGELAAVFCGDRGLGALSVFHRVPFLLEVSDLCSDSIVAVGAMRRRSRRSKCLEKVESFLYSRAARIVAPHNCFQTESRSPRVPECKIDVVVNGVDLLRFSPRPKDVKLAADWGLSPNDFVIGYLGTLGMADRS